MCFVKMNNKKTVIYLQFSIFHWGTIYLRDLFFNFKKNHVKIGNN